MQQRPSLDDLGWPLRTSRLSLRRAVVADGAAVFAYRSLSGVGKWLKHIETDPDVWAGRWTDRLATTIVVEREGEVIGDARIVLQNAHTQGEVNADGLGKEAELMWAFDPAFHGQGYATESLAALIELAFSALGLRRLIARCYADNEPSWRLMERVGMRREGHSVKSTLHRDGIWRDFLSYALLAPEE